MSALPADGILPLPWAVIHGSQTSKLLKKEPGIHEQKIKASLGYPTAGLAAGRKCYRTSGAGFFFANKMNHNESLAPAQNGQMIGLIYEGLPVRMIEHDGEPWFVAHDIGEVLELGHIRQHLARMDDDQKADLASVTNSDACRGLRKDTSLVNESGLYELIFRSSKPEAKRFRKWVTSEVLPQIRKTGSYSLASLPVLIEQVDALKERIDQMESLMRPGDDWKSPGEWCAAHGYSFCSQRMATLAYRCTMRSQQTRKPIGTQQYRLPCGQMKIRRSYSPEIVEEICKKFCPRWAEQDARDAKGGAA